MFASVDSRWNSSKNSENHAAARPVVSREHIHRKRVRISMSPEHPPPRLANQRWYLRTGDRVDTLEAIDYTFVRSDRTMIDNSGGRMLQQSFPDANHLPVINFGGQMKEVRRNLLLLAMISGKFAVTFFACITSPAWSVQKTLNSVPHNTPNRQR